MRRICKGKSTVKDVRIPIPPHGQIQMIKRNKNDHERTSDDNDDVCTLYLDFLRKLHRDVSRVLHHLPWI